MQIAYGAGKAAVEACTRSIAVELGPMGITVNTVAPAPVQIRWIDDDQEEQLVEGIPLGRIGHPGDVANAFAFLASAQVTWITAQVVQASGGQANGNPCAIRAEKDARFIGFPIGRRRATGGR